MIDTACAPLRRAEPAMGTVFSVHVHRVDAGGTDAASAAIDAFFDEVARLEAMFSTFRPDSEISRINRGELAPSECSREVADVLDACAWLDHASEGAFRAFLPEAPATLDPSGFVKGWATERAAALLTRGGCEHWCVSAGGDVLTSGRPASGARWRVGISDPHDPRVVRATIEVAEGAVATSGVTARGMHLWDGRTRERVRPFASFTVIGPSLTWADAFATAGFALGDAGLEWVAQFGGYEAMAIGDDGTIVSRGARGSSPSSPRGRAGSRASLGAPRRG